MTIPSENNRNDYTGNGSTDTYSYTFKIFNKNDLLVTTRDTDDVETTLTVDVDYTVTGVLSASGGTIVLTAGNLTTDYHLTIRRVVDLVQETDIRNQGDFYPETHEDAFDYITMMAQQIDEELGRSLRLAETDSGVSVQLPVAEALKLFRFNAAGTGLELITVADLGSVSTVSSPLKLTGSDLGVDPAVHPFDEWIIISTNPDEQDYATLAAYIADSPAAGDRVLVKDSQTLTAQMILPNSITVRFHDGATINSATNIATSVMQIGSNTIIEGVLNMVLSQTGTTVSGLEINGDNNFAKVIVENSSTGQLTNAVIINAGKGNNHINGIARNTGGGTLTNVLVDNSAEDSNNVILVDEPNTKLVRSDGGNRFATLNLDGALNLGSDADGDIYYRNSGVLQRLAKGTNGQLLQLASGLPVWGQPMQSTWGSLTSVATGTTTIPYDDTIPASTEGDEYVTVTITPKRIGSTIIIDAILLCSPSVAATVAMCLFIDSGTSASKTSFKSISAGGSDVIPLLYRYSTTALDAVTFKIRAGMSTAGTLTVNGVGGASKYGFSSGSHIRAVEVLDI